MILINHRINSLEQLDTVPLINGIELDVRYHKDDLILHHDPFNHHLSTPTLFEEMMANWRGVGPVILNVKTEGVELRCIEVMNKYSITNWFFLDLSMPYFVLFSQKAYNNEIKGFSPSNLAVRFSEYEPIEYALSFTKTAKWVWVDCFTDMPLTKEISDKLNQSGFKICIVSPELQKHKENRIKEFKRKLKEVKVDAVCTKYPDAWSEK